MVHGDEQHVLAVRAGSAARERAGRARRSNAPRLSSATSSLQRAFGSRSPARSCSLERKPDVRGERSAEPAGRLGGESRAQRLVPRDQAVERGAAPPIEVAARRTPAGCDRLRSHRSICARNHSRCCANDSGSGRRVRRFDRRQATPGALFGDGGKLGQNRAWRTNRRAALQRPRPAAAAKAPCTAKSECPPSSKKLSWRPTRSTRSSSPQIRASVSSISPLRRLVAAGGEGIAVRRRQRLAVDLAVGGQRQRLERDIGRRHHVLGQARRQMRAQLFGHQAAAHRPRRVVCHQPLVAGRILARQRPPPRARPDARRAALRSRPARSGTPDLHLEIVAAEILDRSVRPKAAKVARPVEPRRPRRTDWR